MASSLSKHPFTSLILLIVLLISIINLPRSTLCYSSSTLTPNINSSMKNSHLLAIQSVCKSTPYPNVCLNSLKLSISIPNILNFLLQSLQNSINEANKLTSILFSNTNNIIENQRGALQDCKDLHQISLLSLQKSLSKVNSSKLDDARAYLSAALTNKGTCLEGLASASGPRKPFLVNSIIDAYKHVSNSLSMLAHDQSADRGRAPPRGRRLLVDPPLWVRRILLQDDNDGDDDDDHSVTVVVAVDGSGNFTRVQDAVNFAPNKSEYRTFIYVKKGVYEENVEIPSYKPNIVLLGDGSEDTVITNNRSVGDGWTTFRSATVGVSGEGFLARGITFANTAGSEKHQAVALRINADLVAVYKCTIIGYQDTLYVHSFRQFYRECDIYGTIDYIFGNAAVIFQACTIVSRLPLPGQFTVITAQSRDFPEENTGISIHNCSILATEALYANQTTVKSFLGRPWREYSRTVYIESYIDDFIDSSGWANWEGDRGLQTLFYGEYGNQGPGSGTEGRVGWEGYHVMSYEEATNFTVSEFIVGDEWLDSTSFPYDDGI